MDAYFHVKDRMELDKYAAIGVLGGDGSIHEVVNGMLQRDDKKKLPIALFPKGSGNDFCRSFCIKSIDDGINHLEKGYTI